MRRILLLTLMLLLVFPAAAFAQDGGQALWDLTEESTVENLGFQFNYPAGWVLGTNDATPGFRIAENQADLDAVLDSDPETNTKGFSISLIGLALKDLGMDATTPLEDVVTALTTAAGITEQDRTELPVATRRSIVIFGVNSLDRPGIASIWLQKDAKENDVVVLFSIGGSEASSDLAYSWGQILGSVTPIGALPFGDTPLVSPNGDFTMSYPDGWFVSSDQPGAIAEAEADLTGGDTPTGAATVVIESKLADLNGKVTDLSSLLDLVRTNQAWDEAILPTEHIVLDQPAFMFAGANESSPGGWALVTAFIWNDTAVIIGTLFPSEEKFNELKPTYLAMLQSLTPTEPAS